MSPARMFGRPASRVWIPLALAFGAAPARAQVLTFAVSGNPQPMSVHTATAGSQPVSVTSSATTYSMTVALFTWKITAKLSAPLPPGVTLSVSVAAPSGATSLGPVQLSTTAADVVRGITTGSFSSLNITYTISGTAAAGVLSQRTATVTFTAVQGP